MTWQNETRGRRWKCVEHVSDPNRRRISATIAALHYPSVLDSADFNTEIDLTQESYSGNSLGGYRTKSAGFETGFQLASPRDAQKQIGTIGFGARQGEDYFSLCPHSVGYMVDSDFHPVLQNPDFSGIVTRTIKKDFGFFDEDSEGSNWSMNAGAEIDAGPIWTGLGGEAVNYKVLISGGQVEPTVILNQKARDSILANIRTSWFRTSVGAVFKLDWNQIARVNTDRLINLFGDDFEWEDKISLRGRSGKQLAFIGEGQVFVPRRGGRAPIKKRIWFDGSDWWLFLGVNALGVRDDLQQGDLVIDPPITEEDIVGNFDDTSQAGTSMNRSGTANIDYVGRAGSYYSSGWRFTGIPIGNSATVNSSTFEPMQATATEAGGTITLAGFAEDSTGQFGNNPSNLTDRPRTNATTVISTVNLPGNNNRASWDFSSQLQEIVNQPGWATDNNLGGIAYANGAYLYNGFDDYNGGAANACDFNADITEGGGGLAIPIVQAHARRRR